MRTGRSTSASTTTANEHQGITSTSTRMVSSAWGPGRKTYRVKSALKVWNTSQTELVRRMTIDKCDNYLSLVVQRVKLGSENVKIYYKFTIYAN